MEKSEGGAEHSPHLWTMPCLDDRVKRKLCLVRLAAHRRKAPRAQRILGFFAEIRMKRPLARALDLRKQSGVIRSEWAYVIRASGGAALVQAAGFAKAGRAEATQANGLVFVREVRLVRRDR
jgi:hypothetical protein